MFEGYRVLLNEHLDDLNPVQAGEAFCQPEHAITPQLLSMLLHYVISGYGVLYLNGESHRVGPGQAFVLRADDKAYFIADKTDPWHFRWISFTGKLSDAFATLPPVFDAPSDTLCHLRHQPHDPMLAYELAGDLLMLYAAVVKPKLQSRTYVQKAIDYIELSYMNPLSISDIANFVGLNQSYLSKLFKEKTGHTLQQHILHVRLSEAKRHMILGYSIKETAALCGFKDIANFSRLFKREFSQTPTQWRKWGPPAQDAPTPETE